MTSAKRVFAVTSSRGAAWNGAHPLEGQQDWERHAAFMDALQADGFVLLGGPLEGTQDVLLVIRADDAEQIRSRLAADPWMRDHLLWLRSIAPWTLRLGSLA